MCCRPKWRAEGSRVLDLFVKKVRDTAQHQKLPPPR